MQQRRLIDNRRPTLTPSASFRRKRKLRALVVAIAAAMTTTAALRS